MTLPRHLNEGGTQLRHPIMQNILRMPDPSGKQGIQRSRDHQTTTARHGRNQAREDEGLLPHRDSMAVDVKEDPP
jgi:hypothetical protein